MGSPFFIWEEKLRRTKRDLKNWAKTLETPRLKKEKAIAMLEAHQITMESKIVVEEDQNIEIKLQQEIFEACRQEAALGRLKSRCLWLQDGDRNSTFFHKRQTEAKKIFKTV